MRRTILLLTSVTALATGVALLGVGSALTPPARLSAPDAGAARLVVATRFYDAANELLASGDVAPLEAIVAPDLVEHPPRMGGEVGRAGLVTALRSLRTLLPGVRLVVEGLQPTGDDAVTALPRVDTTMARPLLGALTPAAWGPLEVVRVEGDRVVERWRSWDDPLLAAPLGQTALAVGNLNASYAVTISWLSYAPGAEWTVAPAPRTRLVVVESGMLTAVAHGAGGAVAGRPLTPEHAVTLTPGELFVVPDQVGETTRNDGEEPAEVLIVTVWEEPRSASAGVGDARESRQAATLAPASGVRGRVVIGARGVVMRSARPVVAVTRLTIGSGAGLALSASDRRVIVVAETGTIELTREEDNGVEPIEVAAAAAIDLPPGSASRWRATSDEPAVVLVVTIEPRAPCNTSCPPPFSWIDGD